MGDAMAKTMTLDEALHIARALRARLGPMDWSLMDAIVQLAIRHPSMDVLDEFCEGLAPMQSMADADLVPALHALNLSMDMAARYWGGPGRVAA